ncbi:hypothetical protein N7U66_19900 [Lacinutrix neustonica]|uniref:Uncharacterized protein n=1 Tax=Lacinutrix neustonica TaxID=2980107 RepID=A0A9E8MUZ0_9FLAO|nr:hypothetical protein [Lacinutrix neustonica]WAC02038.1 hypothetical protein N7U66_19900 [Lacinutrix neustonica]
MKTFYSLVLLSLFTFLSFSQTIALTSFATGLNSPVEIVNTGSTGDTRLFVVEQAGLIKILNSDGSINPTPFLDISSFVGSGGERGLLGLAFAPDYVTSWTVLCELYRQHKH